jgi:4-hydroxybenzoate polyprenyltransferase
MRPHQWSKNAVVLAAVVFSGQANEAGQVGRALVATFAFCLVSSAIYAFNDWHDRAEDRLHLVKYQRPVASGAISPAMALGLSGILLIASLGLAVAISVQLGVVILVYAALMATYTIWLRRVALLDVLTIALGFVLRAVAGAVAVSVPLSIWLFVCTLLLALLLGAGKRRQELRMLGGQTAHRRPSLRGYARLDLDRVMVIIAVSTAAAYGLYALAVPTYGRDLPMFVTVPFVVLAIGRYLYLVFRRNLGGAPELLLLHDRWLLLGIVAWSIATAIVLSS